MLFSQSVVSGWLAFNPFGCYSVHFGMLTVSGVFGTWYFETIIYGLARYWQRQAEGWAVSGTSRSGKTLGTVEQYSPFCLQGK